MSETPVLSFAEFASQPEYIAVNEKLVRAALDLLPRPFAGVDVATGTGMVPKLVNEIIAQETSPKYPHPSLIIGIDPNPISLQIAQGTTSIHPRLSVLYLEGKGQDAFELAKPHLPGVGADWVSIHDAIHEIPELDQKQAVLAAMARVLRPSGILTLNSAFTTIAMRDSARLWGQFKLVALQELGEKRDRSVPTLPYLAPEDYISMLNGLGLNIVHTQETEVALSAASIKGISKYPAFIEGMTADMTNTGSYTTEEKSTRLIAALQHILANNPNQTFPRIWWEVIAQKPA